MICYVTVKDLNLWDGQCLRGRLARMNVPENIVRNPQRQSAIREFKSRVREETPGNPTRWLPTPPTTSLAPAEKAKAKSSESAPSSCSWVAFINNHSRHLY